MLIGFDVFADRSFASLYPGYQIRGDWREICPNVNVWYAIPVNDSAVTRC